MNGAILSGAATSRPSAHATPHRIGATSIDVVLSLLLFQSFGVGRKVSAHQLLAEPPAREALRIVDESRSFAERTLRLAEAELRSAYVAAGQAAGPTQSLQWRSPPSLKHWLAGQDLLHSACQK